MTVNGVTASVTEHVENSSGQATVDLNDVKVTSAGAGFALGTPVRVRTVAHLGPRAALVLVAGRPVDPGWADDGAGYWTAPVAQVWPSMASQPGSAQSVRVRFVNLPVTIANVGRSAVRVAVTGGATDDQGREAGGVLRDDAGWRGPYGRRPDWTSRQNPPIAPGARVTRYLTVPIPRDSRVMAYSVSPTLLLTGRTLLMSPDTIVFRGR